MRAWNNSSVHSRSGGCVCARRGCTFSTSVAQMQLACSPAGIFFCENSERTYVIQCLSRARRIRIHRGVAEIAERKQPQMDTDSNWKPDLTRVPIPSGEEGPGGTERNVQTPKRRNQGLGMRGRGLRRGMQAEPGETLGNVRFGLRGPFAVVGVELTPRAGLRSASAHATGGQLRPATMYP